MIHDIWFISWVTLGLLHVFLLTLDLFVCLPHESCHLVHEEYMQQAKCKDEYMQQDKCNPCNKPSVMTWSFVLLKDKEG